MLLTLQSYAQISILPNICTYFYLYCRKKDFSTHELLNLLQYLIVSVFFSVICSLGAF